MLRRDYLLKLVQQFIETILKLLKLLASKDEQQFIVVFNEFLMETMNLDLETLVALDNETIIEKIKAIKGYELISSNLKLLLLSTYQLHSMKVETKLKLLSVGLDLATNDEATKIFDMMVNVQLNETISAIMSDKRLFVSLYLKLFCYCLQEKKVADFEDELFFHATNNHNDQEQLDRVATYFYTQLLELPLEELEKQGFTQEEVIEGKKDFYKE